MHDSEKALQISYIIDRKYQRYAHTVAGRLDEKIFTARPYSAGEWNTQWTAFKAQFHVKSFHSAGLIDQSVKNCCSEILNELPGDERSILWLCDTADSSKRDGSLLELYDRVRDLARREAEREVFYATDSPNLELPVSRTSDEFVIPLADYLAGSDLSSCFGTDLHRRMLSNPFRKGQDTEEAVRVLLDNNPDFLLSEEMEQALKIPRDERGEYLFGKVQWNISLGRRNN